MRTDSELPPIKTRIGTRGWRARRRASRVVGNVLFTGLALSVPVGATMLASKVRTGSATAAFEVIGTALGLRPRRRPLGPIAALAGAALLAAGLLVRYGLGARPAAAPLGPMTAEL